MQPNEHGALIPCPLCHQHHCQQDAVCPHCGANLTAPRKVDLELGGGKRSKLGRVMYGPPNLTSAVAYDGSQEEPMPFREFARSCPAFFDTDESANRPTTCAVNDVARGKDGIWRMRAEAVVRIRPVPRPWVISWHHLR